jgi:hypothetical protein
MGISTKDLGSSGSGMPKTIGTGNHSLKINSIALEEYSFIPNAYHIILNVETEPIEGFEGFMIDKDDASKGHYDGQIGRVKASQYAFADGNTKSGIAVYRDRSIMMFLQNLCNTLGINGWFTAQDDKHNTIEDFIAAFNKNADFQDKYLEFCVAGKEYMSKSGYTNYDMWLPKGDKGKYAFAEPNSNKLLIYNEQIHLKKLEVTDVKTFGKDDDDLNIPGKASSDFSLD